eukprot:gene20719-133_t
MPSSWVGGWVRVGGVHALLRIRTGLGSDAAGVSICGSVSSSLTGRRNCDKASQDCEFLRLILRLRKHLKIVSLSLSGAIQTCSYVCLWLLSAKTPSSTVVQKKSRKKSQKRDAIIKGARRQSCVVIDMPSKQNAGNNNRKQSVVMLDLPPRAVTANNRGRRGSRKKSCVVFELPGDSTDPTQKRRASAVVLNMNQVDFHDRKKSVVAFDLPGEGVSPKRKGKKGRKKSTVAFDIASQDEEGMPDAVNLDDFSFGEAPTEEVSPKKKKNGNKKDRKKSTVAFDLPSPDAPNLDDFKFGSPTRGDASPTEDQPPASIALEAPLPNFKFGASIESASEDDASPTEDQPPAPIELEAPLSNFKFGASPTEDHLSAEFPTEHRPSGVFEVPSATFKFGEDAEYSPTGVQSPSSEFAEKGQRKQSTVGFDLPPPEATAQSSDDDGPPAAIPVEDKKAKRKKSRKSSRRKSRRQSTVGGAEHAEDGAEPTRTRRKSRRKTHAFDIEDGDGAVPVRKSRKSRMKSTVAFDLPAPEPSAPSKKEAKRKASRKQSNKDAIDALNSFENFLDSYYVGGQSPKGSPKVDGNDDPPPALEIVSTGSPPALDTEQPQAPEDADGPPPALEIDQHARTARTEKAEIVDEDVNVSCSSTPPPMSPMEEPGEQPQSPKVRHSPRLEEAPTSPTFDGTLVEKSGSAKENAESRGTALSVAPSARSSLSSAGPPQLEEDSAVIEVPESPE